MAAQNEPRHNIIIEGLPLAWMFLVPTSAGVPAETFKFDNLASAGYVPLVPEEAQSANIDIERADGALTRFGKTTLVIDGTDETTVANSAAVGDETLKGEMTLVINEASVESESWPAMIASLITNHARDWLVAIPIGFSYETRELATPVSEGYVFMIGRITNNLDQLMSAAPSNLTLTFKSVKNTALVQANLTGADLFTGIDWKRGDTTVAAMKPTDTGAGDLSTDQADDLILGELVVDAEYVHT